MPESDVTEPLKGTTSTSVFKLFLCSALGGPILVLCMMWLADNMLSAEDAKAFKEPLMGLWQLVTGTSVAGVVMSHLAARLGKVVTQSKQALTEQQTRADAAERLAGRAIGLRYSDASGAPMKAIEETGDGAASESEAAVESEERVPSE